MSLDILLELIEFLYLDGKATKNHQSESKPIEPGFSLVLSADLCPAPFESMNNS